MGENLPCISANQCFALNSAKSLNMNYEQFFSTGKNIRNNYSFLKTSTQTFSTFSLIAPMDLLYSCLIRA